MSPARRIEIHGDVVHRPRKPWTSTVHALLRHLHAQGLPVPEPLGGNEETEHVRLLAGDAGEQAWQHLSDVGGVRSAGALLRRVHDATEGWQPPPDAVWSVPFTPGSVICHGDPQPANFAWRSARAVGLFDWDAARPGHRADDVAYALLWMVPVSADAQELARLGLESPTARRARAAALLEGYGWEGAVDVVDAAVARHAMAIDEAEWLARHGHQPHRAWVDAGWPDRWRAELPRRRRLGRSLGSVRAPHRPIPPSEA